MMSCVFIFIGTGKKRKKGGKETPSGEKADETESQKEEKPPTPEAAEAPKGEGEEGEGEGEEEGETEKAPKTVRFLPVLSVSPMPQSFLNIQTLDRLFQMSEYYLN